MPTGMGETGGACSEWRVVLCGGLFEQGTFRGCYLCIKYNFTYVWVLFLMFVLPSDVIQSLATDPSG